jgi:very-short-patch-repair endonuclease
MEDVCRERMKTGFHRDADDAPGRLLAAPRRHHEAVWAIVAHERIVVRVGCPDRRGHGSTHVEHCWIHLPECFCAWWAQHRVECWSTLEQAAATCWRWDEQQAARNIDVDWIYEIPEELADIVARNTHRPKPAAMAPPSATSSATASPRSLRQWPSSTMPSRQRAGCSSRSRRCWLSRRRTADRNFLIFWRGRAQNALLVEVDNDGLHPPSRREEDGAKERLFETHGFHYRRFSAKRVLANPVAVAREITKVRTARHGK